MDGLSHAAWLASLLTDAELVERIQVLSVQHEYVARSLMFEEYLERYAQEKRALEKALHVLKAEKRKRDGK